MLLPNKIEGGRSTSLLMFWTADLLSVLSMGGICCACGSLKAGGGDGASAEPSELLMSAGGVVAPNGFCGNGFWANESKSVEGYFGSGVRVVLGGLTNGWLGALNSLFVRVVGGSVDLFGLGVALLFCRAFSCSCARNSSDLILAASVKLELVSGCGFLLLLPLN